MSSSVRCCVHACSGCFSPSSTIVVAAMTTAAWWCPQNTSAPTNTVSSTDAKVVLPGCSFTGIRLITITCWSPTRTNTAVSSAGVAWSDKNAPTHPSIAHSEYVRTPPRSTLPSGET